jgi:hypothetical protein
VARSLDEPGGGTMADMTVEQVQLREYAQAVLRQNGVKTARVWYPSPTVLALTVDPSAYVKARGSVPIIQLRADKFRGFRVVLDEPGVDFAALAGQATT